MPSRDLPSTARPTGVCGATRLRRSRNPSGRESRSTRTGSRVTTLRRRRSTGGATSSTPTPSDRDMLAVSWSDDGGLAWSAPVDIGARPAVGIFPAIRPTGELVVVYLWETGQFAIAASRSADGGASWTTPVRIAAVDGGCAVRGFRAFALPSADVDSTGRVWATWHDCEAPGASRTRSSWRLGRRRRSGAHRARHARARRRAPRDRRSTQHGTRRDRVHAVESRGGDRRRAHGLRRHAGCVGRADVGCLRRRCRSHGCRIRRQDECSATTSLCTTRAAGRWSSGCWRASLSGRVSDRPSTRRAADRRSRQSPIGCQTVFSSRKAEISHGLWASAVRADDALDVLGSEPLELGRVALHARDVDRVDVHVPGQPGRELVCEAREDVDGAGWEDPRSRALRRARSRRAGAPGSRSRRRYCRRRARAAFARRGQRAAARSARASRRLPSAPGSVKLKYGPATGFELPRTWAACPPTPRTRPCGRSQLRLPRGPSMHCSSSAARASIISASR